MKKLVKSLRISLKILIILICVLFIVFVGFLTYSTLRDYKPEAACEIDITKTNQRSVITDTLITCLTWNIGYCGLGKEMDFFYDGGSSTRPGEEQFQKYLNGVYNFFANNDSIDFIIVQEIDKDARRSYHTDQVALFSEALSNHAYSFAINYKSDYIPMPIFNPMSDVESGLITFSKVAPYSAQRFAYPLNHSWPTGLFMPDRCFIMQRFHIVGGKDLVLINTHNSAFDDADRLRKYELWMLRGFMLDEYAKGNYIIAGGDWNQCPWDYDRAVFAENVKKKSVNCIEKNLLPASWNCAFDMSQPTNREVNASYNSSVTQTSILDYFIVSPNVEIVTVSVIPTNFEFSDHQPVYLKIRLLTDPLSLCPVEYADLIKMLTDSIQTLNGDKDKEHDHQKKPMQQEDRFYQRK